jgi:hypothetical protein
MNKLVILLIIATIIGTILYLIDVYKPKPVVEPVIKEPESWNTYVSQAIFQGFGATVLESLLFL